MDTKFLYLLGGGFCAVGCVIFLFLSRALKKALNSRSWNCVPGVIQSTATRTVISRAPGDSRFSGHAAEIVDFEYVYQVNGITYSGSRVTFSDNVVKSRGALSALADKYREGDSVSVYYDPASPDESVLMTGPSLDNVTPFITAALFLIVGGLMISYAGGS